MNSGPRRRDEGGERRALPKSREVRELLFPVSYE